MIFDNQLCSGTTILDVYRKTMGDAPLAYCETVGGVKVSEEDTVTEGRNDVRILHLTLTIKLTLLMQILSFRVRR